MAAITYKFQFFKGSAKQTAVGILGNCNIELWFGDKCIIKTTNWALRKTNEGTVFPSSPGHQYQDKGGNTKYAKYIWIWPTVDGGANTSAMRNDFNVQFTTAYNVWANSNGITPVTQRAMPDFEDSVTASFAPAPKAVTLPPGWRAGKEIGTGRAYYTTAKGNAVYADDPKVVAYLAEFNKSQPVAPSPVVPQAFTPAMSVPSLSSTPPAAGIADPDVDPFSPTGGTPSIDFFDPPEPNRG